MESHPLRIFTGSTCEQMGILVSKQLNIDNGKIRIYHYADGEISVNIDETVRGRDSYVLVSTGSPVHENIMELLLITDTLKRASSEKITAIVPYLAYSRQDRKTAPHVPISSALIAELFEASGINRLVSIDLHCGQIQGFYRIPVDNLSGGTVLVHSFINIDLVNLCIISPDAGGVERADRFRHLLEKNGKKSTMAVINKSREKANVVASMELVGSVEDKDCIIVDDIIDTAGTLCHGAEMLLSHGARRVFACASHGLFNGDALSKIQNSSLIKVVVLDTVPEIETKLRLSTCTKVEIMSSSSLISEAVRRIHIQESISDLF